MRTTGSLRFGGELRRWRTARHLSQLDLALEAGVSARHLSCLETGRAQPSREMVLVLAEALDVPLRERNTLLRAAGFADLYRTGALDGPDLAGVRRALEFVLERHQPYGAVVVDRAYQVLMANQSGLRLMSFFCRSPPEPPLNLMRLLFDPRLARPFIENWDELASAMMQRLHREAAACEPDSPVHRLRSELLAAPGVPVSWRAIDYAHLVSPMVPFVIARDGVRVSLFSILASIGTPVVDVTLHELRLETFFPTDAASDKALRALVS